MTTEPKAPLLSKVLMFFGLTLHAVAILCFMLMIAHQDEWGKFLMYCGGCVFSGLVLVGLAEVVELIAKIEVNTRRDGGAEGKK